MQQLKLVSLFAVCSLLSACKGSGPQITVCILDPVAQTLECGRPDDTKFTLALSELNPESPYACMLTEDLQTLVAYVKEKCK